MKKLLLLFASAMLCAILCLGICAAETIEIKMTIGEKTAYVNGQAKDLDTAPIIRENRTMLPVRFIAESVGAKVEWDGETSTATIITDKTTLKITVGAYAAIVSGITTAIDSPAFIENDRVYLPVRFIAECLGGTVDWNGETSTATITFKLFIPFPDDYAPILTDAFYFTLDNVLDFVNLGDYKGLVIDAVLPEGVTEKEIENYINELLEENPNKVEITDRAAKNGDKIIVNFIGKIDGVPFDGGTAYNYEITLGNGGFIAGFEEGMVGMKVGETKAVETVFPENYQNKDLAGKPAVFDITLLSIYEEEPAKLTDDYVKKIFGHETVAKFTEAITASLTAAREEEIISAKLNAILQKVVETAKVLGFPERMIEDYMFYTLNSVKETAAQYGIPYEMLLSYSGYTVEDYETQVREVAEITTIKDLALVAIAKAEGLLVSKEECAEFIKEFIGSYGITDVAEFCKLAGYSEKYFNSIMEFTALTEKAKAFLIENNIFTK